MQASLCTTCRCRPVAGSGPRSLPPPLLCSAQGTAQHLPWPLPRHRHGAQRHPIISPHASWERQGEASSGSSSSSSLAARPPRHGPGHRPRRLQCRSSSSSNSAPAQRQQQQQQQQPAPGTSPAASPSLVVDPARLVSALEKIAAAGHRPEPHWVDMVLAAAPPALPALSLRQLAGLAASLRQLQLQPERGWAEALLQASEAAMRSAALQRRPSAAAAAELVAWAAADGRLEPEAGWVGSALQQVQLQAHLAQEAHMGHDSGGAGGAGGAGGGGPPPPSSLPFPMPGTGGEPAAAQPGAALLSPGQAADMAWAAAALGYRPADSVLGLLAAATLSGSWEGPGAGGGGGGGGLALLAPEQLGRLAWAFATYNYFPPDEWVQAYWLDGIWRRDVSPGGACSVLWSLGAMQLPAEGLWLKHYFLTTAGRLVEVPPQGLVNALWGLAACRELAPAGEERGAEEQGGGGGGGSAQSGPSAPVRPSQPAAGPGGPGGLGGRGGRGQGGEEEEDAAVRALMGQQLAALMERLLAPAGSGGGTPAQRAAAEKLRAALDRRLRRETAAAAAAAADADSAGAAGGVAAVPPPPPAAAAAAAREVAQPFTPGLDAGPVPAAWALEWFAATQPCLADLERPLLVKALWAVAMLEMPPPAAWMAAAAAAAQAAAAAGGCEPTELLYISRSADSLAAVLRRAQKALAAVAAAAPSGEGKEGVAAGASQSAEKGGEGGEAGEDEAAATRAAAAALAADMGEARAAAAALAGAAFEALSRQRLPPNWRRMNPRFPPYAQPKRLNIGGGGGGGGGGEA